MGQPHALPVGSLASRGLGQWGVGALIASEAALFAYLLFSYFYIGATTPIGWLSEPHPKFFPALPNTLLLLASSGAAWFGERGVKRERRGQAIAGLIAALVMGTVFAGVQVFEWTEKSYGIGQSSYASLYFITTGLHLAHVAAGLLILMALIVWVARDFFSSRRRITVSVGILYWHFVDLVWLFVFATYYLTPYLGFGR